MRRELWITQFSFVWLTRCANPFDSGGSIASPHPKTYLNTEIDSTLSPESLIALLAESQKAIFIRLLGQSEPQTHTFIDSLRDFVQSDCSICMLCVDSAYYEIYAKQDITPFEHVLADFPCEHIEMLSGSEITRETMLV